MEQTEERAGQETGTGTEDTNPAAEQREDLAQVVRKTHARRVLHRIVTVLLTVGLVIAVLAAYVAGNWFYSQKHFEITFYQIASDHVSENVRVIFLSDIHNREYGEGNGELLREIEALSPDLILAGGDMISRGDTDDTPMLNLFAKLSEIAPLYGVLGNHELERMYPSVPAAASAGLVTVEKDSDLPERYLAAGMRVLRNESVFVPVGKDAIQIIGVEGTEAGVDLYGARERLDEMTFRDNAFRIMLTHIPILFREKLQPYPFELGLAGHTHGGLVRFPVLGGLYSDEEGFLPKWSGGAYPLENGAELIISRGLGDSRRIPRVNNVPEVVVIDINWC